MKKLIMGLAMILLSTAALADQISVSWDISAGATSYTLYQSVDQGVVWTKLTDVTIPAAVVVVPGDRLVLIRVSATNAAGESVNFPKGIYYNGKWNSSPRGLRVD